MERKRWHTVVFKGGGKVHFRAHNVRVKSVGGRITGLATEGSRFVFCDIDQILAVWVGKV